MKSLFLVPMAVCLLACGSFDDPTIVKDMRVLGVIAEPPEILVPAEPSDFDPLSLPEVRICALVADPGISQELSYSMLACPPNNSGRCSAGAPSLSLGDGTVSDPEEATAPVEICGTLGPSPVLAEILESSISIDSLSGFGAIDIQVQIRVWPAGGDIEAALFATKQMRFGAMLPVDRVANTNPSLESIVVTKAVTGMRGLDFVLPLGRCRDIEAPIVAPGETIGLLPMEAPEVREEYLVPTFEGGSRSFVETLRYSFFSTSGTWSRGETGGGRDISGSLPTLDTTWTAPKEDDLGNEGLDVSFFVIQRDERGGQSWAQSCVRVEP